MQKKKETSFSIENLTIAGKDAQIDASAEEVKVTPAGGKDTTPVTGQKYVYLTAKVDEANGVTEPIPKNLINMVCYIWMWQIPYPAGVASMSTSMMVERAQTKVS